MGHVGGHDGGGEEHILICVLDMGYFFPILAGDVVTESCLESIGLLIILEDEGIGSRVEFLECGSGF